MALNDGLPSLPTTAAPAGGAPPESDEDNQGGGQPQEGQEAPEGQPPEGEEGEQQPEAEWEVTEIDGLQVAVPKGKAEEIKAGFLKAKDYTTKTQDLATKRAAVEAREAELANEAKAQSEFLKDVVKIEAVKADLDRYTNFTPAQWGELARTNQGEYAAHQANYQRLQREFNTSVTTLKAKQTERRTNAQRETAKRLDAGKAEVAKIVPGWNDEAAKRVQATARSVGFSDQEWESAFEDPRLIRLAHLASVGEAALKKPAQPPPKVIEPLKQLGSRQPAPSGLSDKLSIDEWMSRFNQKRQHRKMG